MGVFLCSVSFGGISNFLLYKFTQGGFNWRLQSNNRLQVIIDTRPEWCYACKLYEPIVTEVATSNEFPEVDFVINTEAKLLESPGYVPWTLIKTNNEECRDDFSGFVSADELRARVLRAILCDKLHSTR